MVTARDIQCSVITPEEQVLETEATSVVLPAHDGLIGILKDRAPLLCELGQGILRIDTLNDGQKEIFIDGGFAQVLSNEVIILTDRASAGDELSRAESEKALALAEQMTGDAAERLKAVNRARSQIRIAKNP